MKNSVERSKTTPLLPTSTDPHPQSPPPSAAAPDEDIIERCLSTAGTAQLLRALLVSLAWAFDAQPTFISVFTDADPAWHCTGADLTCTPSSNRCALPDAAWAWDRPAHATMVSEWSLHCASPVVLGLPSSSYFFGCLVGGFMLATLADSLLGRKKLLALCCLIMSVAAGLTPLSQNVWVYAALRFVCGFGRAAVGAASLVLARETVGKRWRDWISVSCYIFFTVGFLSLPALAYLARERDFSWRTLYCWTSIPCFFYSILIFYLARESPRWLLISGRTEEAIKTLGVEINGAVFECSRYSPKSNISDALAPLMMLWEKKWALRRLVAVMIVAFGMGPVYYGMPLNVGSLGSNLYISVTINALAELPASLLTYFMLGAVNRRSSSLVLSTVSGVFSVLCVVVANKGMQMAAEVVSFFSACTAFSVVFIYSTELFPTCVRSSAVSMVRQALVLGGVLAPVLVALGRERRVLSFGVFGLLIGGCGLFVALLPETRGRGVSDDMEEEEYKDRGLIVS